MSNTDSQWYNFVKSVFFFFPNFLEWRQCIYLQYWLGKNVRMFYTKKVSVSRMILKCNSEDVKKARIGKSSFLISAVSKNPVMSVFFLRTFPGILTAVELSLICAKVQIYNSTFSTLQADPRNFQRDASTENDHLKTFTLRE